MELAHRRAPGPLEKEGEDAVDQAGEARRDHLHSEGGRVAEMLRIGLADLAGVPGKGIVVHFGCIARADPPRQRIDRRSPHG